MRMTTRLALIAAVGLGLTQIRASADEPKGDLAELQGSWSAKVGPDKDIPIILLVKDSAVEISVTRPDGEEIKLKGRLKLDDQASPKTIDWLDFATPQGDTIPPNLGLYKLENGVWTTCSGGPGNDRPSKFEAGEGGPPMLTTWARVPEKPAPIAGDLGKFQGTWTGKGGEDEEVSITLTIKDNTIKARWERGDGTEVEFTGEMKLDEKANPRTVDFVHFKRSNGEEAQDQLGIYAFDGDDKVKIQTGGPGNDRPTELKPGNEGEPNVFVLTRKKG
ncbi:hypothetical protein P12x_000931 [Tundrisphaera lichenicola]|uniref:hypothetical protein n=1 Tax=Tundrisphaera lichenicola TaxID=2029860 RepID=UPI003EBF3438